MNEQEQQKAEVRSRLERIWTRWQAGLARRDHQLVVLAVPTYPGDIEAVSAMDMQDVADLLAVFAEHRKANPNELHAIKPAAEPAPQQDWKSLDEGVTDGQAAGAGPEQVGQGDDGGRAPQERADAPAQPNEGDAAVDALELIGREEKYLLGHLSADCGLMPGDIQGAFHRIRDGLSRPLVMPELSPGELDRLARELATPGSIVWLKDVPIELRERRIAEAVAAGTPCDPYHSREGRDPSQNDVVKCRVCGSGPCTGMVPRPIKA